jgi:hypothetical protein
MKRIRITHKTEYHYRRPVTFGPPQASLRPREGHDVHIESSLLKVEPEAEVRWLRGTWEGPADAFDRMEVSVQVV